MNIHSTNTVGELAVAIPGATRIFETLGIDYCCGGNRTLDEVCRASNLALETVMRSLTQTQQSLPVNLQTQDWQQTTLVALLAYIVDKHHHFTRSELTRLEGLINKVCSVHGQNHPELLKLRRLFQTVREDLLPHMLKEEEVLFPYIEQLEKAVSDSQTVEQPFFGTVQNPVRMMMFEHDTVGEILVEMRKVTNNYTVPPEGCISYRTLYQALQDFEYDLHQHIHLENNLAFPRAIEIENRTKLSAQVDARIEQNSATCCS
jgi:regulator of cell morphogenesis and NO signaling